MKGIPLWPVGRGLGVFQRCVETTLDWYKGYADMQTTKLHLKHSTNIPTKAAICWKVLANADGI